MLAFADDVSAIGIDTKVRDDSPDSVITQGANFSVFSSATASMDRLSFESDGEDHESAVSDIPRRLAGRGYREYPSRAPDLELNRDTVQKGSDNAPNKEKSGRVEEVDPPKHSFSTALEECQRRRLRPERKRTASLDLNSNSSGDVYGSPRLGTMTPHQRGSAFRKSGIFASPGTPSLRPCYVQPKGWSSERVPLPSTCTRRYGTVLSGHTYNGKSLPSKWEDAEKWIFSPLSGDAPNRPPSLPPRRPKSKSGPIVVIGSGSSPTLPVPCAGTVLLPSPFQFSGEDGMAEASPSRAESSHTESSVIRSASVHGWSDLVIQAPESPESLQVCSEAKPDSTKDAATMISPAVSRRDMATQMSPEASSTPSSPRGRNSSSSSLNPPVLSIMELQQIRHLSKLEIRDVEVDDRITMTRRSRKFVDKIPLDIGDWQKKSVDARASAWEVAETAKCVSKCKREEAKIAAWENLQKAKAEAEIRKLEMKLERMRSSSMEKIMNKLRSAQRKAQEMRISVSTMQAQRVAKTATRAASFRRAGHMSSLSGCFTCHAS